MLSRVVVPQTIVVHDGAPTDSLRKKVTMWHTGIISRTWRRRGFMRPSRRSTIIANVLAIMSFTLNRVYTEWYRNPGYDLRLLPRRHSITNGIYGGDIFRAVSEVVDDIFDNYLSRPVWGSRN